MTYIPNTEPESVGPDILWRVLSGVAKQAASQHDFNSAAMYYQHSLMAAEKTFGCDDFRVGLILLDCADMCCQKSDYRQARHYIRRARKVIDHYIRVNDNRQTH